MLPLLSYKDVEMESHFLTNKKFSVEGDESVLYGKKILNSVGH